MSDNAKTTAERIAEMIARKPTCIHIARNGVWSADIPSRYSNGTSSLFSYEKLDYHAGCREFLEGLRDAGIPFVFHGTVTL